MSIFNQYYAKEIAADRNRYKAQKAEGNRKRSGVPCLGQLAQKLTEADSSILQGLEDILLPAKEFLATQLADRQDLDAASPEATFLNGVMGVIQQFTPATAEDLTQGMLKEKISLMADKLEALSAENGQGSIGDYISKLVYGLRRYKNQIDPATSEDPLATPEEGGEGPPPEEEVPPGEETPGEGEEEVPEEDEEDDSEQLARELGIA